MVLQLWLWKLFDKVHVGLQTVYMQMCYKDALIYRRDLIIELYRWETVLSWNTANKKRTSACAWANVLTEKVFDCEGAGGWVWMMGEDVTHIEYTCVHTQCVYMHGYLHYIHVATRSTNVGWHNYIDWLLLKHTFSFCIFCLAERDFQLRELSSLSFPLFGIPTGFACEFLAIFHHAWESHTAPQ